MFYTRGEAAASSSLVAPVQSQQEQLVDCGCFQSRPLVAELREAEHREKESWGCHGFFPLKPHPSAPSSTSCLGDALMEPHSSQKGIFPDILEMVMIPDSQ